MEDTKEQYHNVISKSREIFIDKNADYGSSWRVLRIISLVDQINIKAQRIRNLQNNIANKIDEDQIAEFYGIINYSIMALIQIEKGIVDEPDLDADEIIKLYDKIIEESMKDFSRFEIVKKYRLLPDLWTLDKEELTPSLKVVRKKIQENYQNIIDEMYN